MLSTYGVSIWHDYWPDNSSSYLNYYFYKDNNTITEPFDSFLSYIFGPEAGWQVIESNSIPSILITGLLQRECGSEMHRT